MQHENNNNNSISDKFKILDDQAPRIDRQALGETSNLLLGKDSNESSRKIGVDARLPAQEIAVNTGGGKGLDAPNFDSGAPSTSYNQ